MNETIDPMLYKQSADLLRSQLPAHISWISICILTFLATGFLLYAVASSSAFRKNGQGLIFAVFVNDLIQSILWGIVGCKRLYLVANNLPELTSQFVCMAWMIPIQLTDFSSNFIILCISLDRLIAITTPIWYRDHNKSMKLTLIGVTPPLSIAFALLGLLTSSKTKINLACTAAQSYPAVYDQVATVSQNCFIALVVVFSLTTAAMILRRYVKHRRQHSELKVFKREIELHIVLRLGALIVTFLISQGASNGFIPLIRASGLSEAQKAALGPTFGCLHLSRSLLDCVIYFGFCPEYRNASRAVVARICKFGTPVTDFTGNLSSSARVARNSSSLCT